MENIPKGYSLIKQSGRHEIVKFKNTNQIEKVELDTSQDI